MEEKQSLKYYRSWKRKVVESCREDRALKAMQGNVLLTKGRTGRSEEERKCEVCREKEDLEHVLKRYVRFSSLRERHNIKEEMEMAEIIFGGREVLLAEIFEEWLA